MPATKNIIVNLPGNAIETDGQAGVSDGIIIQISNLDGMGETLDGTYINGTFDMRLYSAVNGKELDWSVEEEDTDPKQIYIIGYKEDGGGLG